MTNPIANPDPGSISAAMWAFWLRVTGLIPGVRYGGTYARKPGYHNTREGLPETDYSVQLPDDKLGPDDKCAAIDLTFPDAQSGRYETIMKYAGRLLASGKDPDDERGNYLREFYGQADTDQYVEGWDYQRVGPATSDTSHLWHIHISVLRRYAADPIAYDALYSILSGETVAAWRTRTNNGTTTGGTTVDEATFKDLHAKVEGLYSFVIATTNGTKQWTTPHGQTMPNVPISAIVDAAEWRDAVDTWRGSVTTRLAGLADAVAKLSATVTALAARPAGGMTPEQVSQVAAAARDGAQAGASGVARATVAGALDQAADAARSGT